MSSFLLGVGHLVSSLAVVALTLLMLAGYERSREGMERYRNHLSAVFAAILALMGISFVFG